MLSMVLEIITELSLILIEKEKEIVQTIFIIVHNSLWPLHILLVKISFLILIKLLIHSS